MLCLPGCSLNYSIRIFVHKYHIYWNTLEDVQEMKLCFICEPDFLKQSFRALCGLPDIALSFIPPCPFPLSSLPETFHSIREPLIGLI